jgi:hypothetical protein
MRRILLTAVVVTGALAWATTPAAARGHRCHPPRVHHYRHGHHGAPYVRHERYRTHHGHHAWRRHHHRHYGYPYAYAVTHDLGHPRYYYDYHYPGGIAIQGRHFSFGIGW